MFEEEGCEDGINKSSVYNQEQVPTLPLVFRNKEKYMRLKSGQDYLERVVSKRGRQHIFSSKIPNKRARFFKDLGNTLIHIRWRWILLTLGLVNTLAYLAFSGMWLLNSWISGDFDVASNATKPCIIGAHSYTGYLLLSIESITTTGYGYVYPTDNCRMAWFVLTLNTLVVIVIDGAFFTVVYVKISKPIGKDVVKFSKRAVICLRNGKLCLVFRIADRSGKHLIRTKITAYMIKQRFTTEGESLHHYMTPLKLNKVEVFIWPTDVVHEITETSPFWEISANDLMALDFEILVVLKGDSVSTGQPSQSQTSYICREILWGHRFGPCIEISSNGAQYLINYNLFNKTNAFDTPLCSAQNLSSIQNEVSITKSKSWVDATL